MDHRTSLQKGAVLALGGLSCVIDGERGRGSGAIVYDAHYRDALNEDRVHRVLLKELFPYTERGEIRRSDSGEIVVAPEAQGFAAFHRRCFTEGNGIHLQMREKHPSFFGGNINTYEHGGTCYTILDVGGGVTPTSVPGGCGGGSLRTAALRMLGLLDSLRLFHEAGLLHLDVSADNVLLIRRGNDELVELIDYNSAVRQSDLQEGQGVHISMKPGYTAPEIRCGDMGELGVQADIYAAAAVFFHMVMGRTLTLEEQNGSGRLNLGESPLLEDAPAGVVQMTARILTRGLAMLPRRRYPSCPAMAEDVEELIRRIDGVGITHSSLWEMSAAAIRERIRRNPSLSHLTEEDRVYPVAIEGVAGGLGEALLKGRRSAFLLGDGGMGKTTLLMGLVLAETRVYRAGAPVPVYLPLYDYREGDGSYIRDSILRRLRFDATVRSYATARHILEELLQKPFGDGSPSVCLLLDGYNEAGGDTTALRGEIRLLSEMAGVSLCITSRSHPGELPFDVLRLCPLADDTVEAVLAKHGLLLPEGEPMGALLRNPMMLGMYVKAASGGEAPRIDTKEELIYAYLRALLRKETEGLPEDAPLRWQTDAAVWGVLPVVAYTETVWGVNGERRLRKHMQLLFRCLKPRSGDLRRVFPSYAGRGRDLRGEAENGDEWARFMVESVLWRRLGLVQFDSGSGCRVSHQELRDVLAGEGRRICRSLRGRQTARRAAICAACLACAVTVGGLLPREELPLPPAYDPAQALAVLEDVQGLYCGMEYQWLALDELLGNSAPESLLVGREYNHFDDARQQIEAGYIADMFKAAGENPFQVYSYDMERLRSSGERFPWNEAAFEELQFGNMVNTMAGWTEKHLSYIDKLEEIYEAYGPSEEYERMKTEVSASLDVDKRMAATYYYLLHEQCVQGLSEWENTAEGGLYDGTFTIIATQNEYNGYYKAFFDTTLAEKSLDEINGILSTLLRESTNAYDAVTDLRYELIVKQKT